MRRACRAPLRPSKAPTEGKSRGAEGPFGRGVQRGQGPLWWGPGAKPLVAEGETGGVQRGQSLLWRGAGAEPLRPR